MVLSILPPRVCPYSRVILLIGRWRLEVSSLRIWSFLNVETLIIQIEFLLLLYHHLIQLRLSFVARLTTRLNCDLLALRIVGTLGRRRNQLLMMANPLRHKGWLLSRDLNFLWLSLDLCELFELLIEQLLFFINLIEVDLLKILLVSLILRLISPSKVSALSFGNLSRSLRIRKWLFHINSMAGLEFSQVNNRFIWISSRSKTFSLILGGLILIKIRTLRIWILVLIHDPYVLVNLLLIWSVNLRAQPGSLPWSYNRLNLVRACVWINLLWILRILFGSFYPRVHDRVIALDMVLVQIAWGTLLTNAIVLRSILVVRWWERLSTWGELHLRNECVTLRYVHSILIKPRDMKSNRKYLIFPRFSVVDFSAF